MTTSDGQARLAVLNPQRRVLDGPCFLDRLLKPASSQHTAIDYHTENGHVSKLSYEQLDLVSSRLAGRLSQYWEKHSVKTPIVPVIISQHPALYASYLAVLKSGAAFCPITPDTPSERIRFIVQDVNARLVLCQEPDHLSLTKLLTPLHCLNVNVQELQSSDPDDSGLNLFERQPTDIAYVMYTSGSTGKPKGVAISHYAVTQSLLAHEEHIPNFNRFLQFAAPTFDVSVFEVFFPWLRGVALICCEKERILADLPGTIRRLNIDAVELTPTVVTTLLGNRAALRELKCLLTIGEMLTTRVVREFGGSSNTAGILFAMYGPTEATIHCTIVPQMGASTSVRNIGRPLSTVTAFILKETENKIAEIGEIGELALAGQLADGYLNRPEQTATSFIQLSGHGTVYRTGDRASISSEGEIQIFGRTSTGQIKIRGQRVELGEIEEVAIQVEEVTLASAMVICGELVLFCSGDLSLEAKMVEKRCKRWLPRHMRPRDIIVVSETLPRLPSGKIDRKKLEEMYSRHSSINSIEEPSEQVTNGDEAYLLSVFSNDLGLSLARKTPLKSCGIDSLCAIRLASRLRDRFSKISISAILEADTIEELSLVLANIAQQGQPDETHNLDQRQCHNGVPDDIRTQSYPFEVEEYLPCAPIQLVMLAESLDYVDLNISEIVVTANIAMSLSDLVTAFAAVAQKNSILRSAFVATGNVKMPFVQLVKRSASFDSAMTLLDPIQLKQGSTDREFVIAIHHALYDGWSWDLIMVDLNTSFCGGLIRPRPAFPDFVC